MHETGGNDPDRDPTQDGGPASWQRLKEEIGRHERHSWLSVLPADQQRRSGPGERGGVELVFEAFPMVGGGGGVAVGLICREAMLGGGGGGRPTAQGFAARFPPHAGELRRQFLLFRALPPPPTDPLQ